MKTIVDMVKIKKYEAMKRETVVLKKKIGKGRLMSLGNELKYFTLT